MPALGGWGAHSRLWDTSTTSPRWGFVRSDVETRRFLCLSRGYASSPCRAHGPQPGEAAWDRGAEHCSQANGTCQAPEVRESMAVGKDCLSVWLDVRVCGARGVLRAKAGHWGSSSMSYGVAKVRLSQEQSLTGGSCASALFRIPSQGNCGRRGGEDAEPWGSQATSCRRHLWPHPTGERRACPVIGMEAWRWGTQSTSDPARGQSSTGTQGPSVKKGHRCRR